MTRSFLRRLPQDLVPLGRLHQRLSLSRADFKHAKLVAERILRSKLHERYRGPNAELLRALNCSMVMAYTRPFCGSQARRGSEVAALPGKYLRLLTADQLGVHKTVMRDRNKFLAHTDADAVDLEPLNLQLPNGKVQPMQIGNDRMAPLDAAATALLASAATSLLECVLVQVHELDEQLGPYFRTVTPEGLFGASGDA